MQLANRVRLLKRPGRLLGNFIVAYVLLFVSINPVSLAETDDRLPNLGAEISQTSVSGLSSGAYMAGQFQIAHSKIVVGAGIVAGGPYGCAESWQARSFPFWPGIVGYNTIQATQGCMKYNLGFAGIPNIEGLVDDAKLFAASEKIDSLQWLQDDKVYVFSGLNDTIVERTIVEAAIEFYQKAGVPPHNIAYKKGPKAGHGFLTETKGQTCEVSEKPYILDCDYDQAGSILKQIYGPLNDATAQPAGQFIRFNQDKYISDSKDPGLGKFGFVYVPENCMVQPGCRVHINFHGCDQNLEAVDDRFVKESGFLGWADNNRLILLFPQTRNQSSNPAGCWDWWGYTGLQYRIKSSPQIKAVRNMLEILSKPPISPN